MIYLGLSLFLFVLLFVLRQPVTKFFEWISPFVWRAAIGLVCLYALHLTASYVGEEWSVPINYFTAGFSVICGVPGVIGIFVLSFFM